MSLLSRSIYESAREASNIVDIFRSNTFTDRPMYLEVQASMVCKIGPMSAPTRRQKKAAQVTTCLSVADTWCLQWLYKKNGWEILLTYFSICVLEVVIADLPQPWPTSPETLWWASYFNWPSSWFDLIQSSGAFWGFEVYARLASSWCAWLCQSKNVDLTNINWFIACRGLRMNLWYQVEHHLGYATLMWTILTVRSHWGLSRPVGNCKSRRLIEF